MGYNLRRSGFKNKAIKTNCNLGHYHPSRSEAGYCLWLQARVQNKEIKDFKYIHNIELHIAGKVWRKWAVDFKVIENDGSFSYHESKGWSRSDDRFRMKLSAFRLEYPDIPVFVNKKQVTSKGWRRERPL